MLHITGVFVVIVLLKHPFQGHFGQKATWYLDILINRSDIVVMRNISIAWVDHLPNTHVLLSTVGHLLNCPLYIDPKIA